MRKLSTTASVYKLKTRSLIMYTKLNVRHVHDHYPI